MQHSSTKPMVAVLALVIHSACATTTTPPTSHVQVLSDPPGALVTLAPDQPSASSQTVLGLTPATAELHLATGDSMRLRIEQRGYQPRYVDVDTATSTVSVKLEPATVRPTGLPGLAGGMALIGPEIEVILRRFASEEVSADLSLTAADAIAGALSVHFDDTVEVSRVPAETPGLDALLRDARAAVATLDPIRLPFLTTAPRLQSAAGRRAANAAAAAAGAPLLLLIDGRSSLETAGMKAGKAGILIGGTAASYGSGFAQASAGGDSFFTYNIYLPSSSSGTRLDAVLIHGPAGEVLWINRGFYAPIDPDRPGQMEAVVADLLTGMSAQPAGRPPCDS